MVKLGIVRREKWSPAKDQRRVSLQLLRTSIPATYSEIVVFEAIMREIRLASGVFRTTSRGRLRDIDTFVNELLAQRYRSDAPLLVDDWAASDCLTSAEWATSLFTLFPNTRLQASDLTLFLLEITLPDRSTFIVERSGEPLQYVQQPFVIRLNPSGAENAGCEPVVMALGASQAYVDPGAVTHSGRMAQFGF